jgi:hypothetical protein
MVAGVFSDLRAALKGFIRDACSGEEGEKGALAEFSDLARVATRSLTVSRDQPRILPGVLFWTGN